MNAYQLVENYSPVGDMITVVTCWVLLFVIAKVVYFSGDRKFVYLKRTLHFILVGAISNIAFYLAITKYEAAPWVLFVFRAVYHTSLLCCLHCFMLYMKKMLDINGPEAKVFTVITRITFLVCVILDASSAVTKMGFHLENGLWKDGIVSPFNFFYAYALVIFIAMLLLYSNRLIRSVRICLISTEIAIGVIMLYQGFLNINTFSTFTYLLPVLVVLIMLHSRPFDDKTGALGERGFETFIKRVDKKGISVDYMVLKLHISVADQLPDELGKVLNSFWHSSFRDATLFSLSTDLYILAIPRNKKNGNTEKKMDELVSNHFSGYYEKFRITYKMIKLYNMDFVENVEDVSGMLKYLLQSMDENTLLVVDEKLRQQLKAYKYIRDGLMDIEAANNLNDPRVLVYCQPIRNMKTGKYDTAEALMRLSLPETGLVMPGVFIGIAEQYNHIHALSKIMLNKVCLAVKDLENQGYQFSRISVNFAASEIKEEGFCGEILEIIRSAGISPSKIGIELTETQSESDFVIVKNTIQTLHEAGMTLYLDDVGTGYSNLDRIVRYDVDVVKFDRFFLLEAEKSEKTVKMIRHLSEAFRDLDYMLLYEGVETEEHETLCLGCGADYIQGFKYAKPVPVEELNQYFVRNAQ